MPDGSNYSKLNGCNLCALGVRSVSFSFRFAMSKRQAALTSFGFGGPGSTPPPEKHPATAEKDLPVTGTDPDPSTSGGRADSQVPASKFSNLHPPYDLGEVQEFVRQQSHQER